jgi:SAM-dependent methyltransferase
MEWWEEFFDNIWLEGGFLGTGERSSVEKIDYLWRQLRLKPGSRLADICCGIGRDALPLAERGIEVTGVDFSQKYLDYAEEHSTGLPLRFVCADMRQTGLPGSSFDAVTNLWTSFGYFEDEAENEHALAEMARLLKPSGRLVMQMASRDGILHNFRPRSFDKRGDWLVLEEGKFDYHTSRNNGHWLWIDSAGKRYERDLSLRMYCLHELRAMGEHHGLSLLTAHGNFAGEELSNSHTHMLLTFIKE